MPATPATPSFPPPAPAAGRPAARSRRWAALALALALAALPLRAAAADPSGAAAADPAGAPAAAPAPAAVVATAPRSEPAVLDAALSAPGGGDAFPATGPRQAVALPDDWSRTRAGAGGSVWYRVAFTVAAPPPPGEMLGLLVERACSSLRVQLNGHLVHGSGRVAGPLADNCNRPQLVALPAALLQPGANTLDLLVAGPARAEVASRLRAGGLSELRVGLLPALQAQAARALFVNVQLPLALGATLLLMGCFMFVLGFINRRESHLAYFGALSVGWAMVDAQLWLGELPLPQPLAEFALVALLGFTTWAAVQFLLRHAGMRLRVADLGLPLQCALLPVTLVLAGPQNLRAAAGAWSVLLALQVAAAAVLHLRLLWSGGSPARWPMALLLGAVGAAGALELAAQWSGARPLASHLLQLVVPVMFVLMGLRLVQQHGHARFQAEQGRAQLEQRVREATAEIERNFRLLSELKVEQVTERERKRIAADLHDDLGAKLLTIVHTSDSERISTLAREALEEMRLSVRGLTGRAVRLGDALGDWRVEVVSRLAQAGIEGEWEAPEDLPQTLSARAYVQTTRILREATSNVIKHSQASRCSVRCRVADGAFEVVVQDNGQGIPTEVDARLDRGHGMATMKSRARQLQGQCLVESGPGYGTVIRLTIPLERALEGA